MDALQDIFERMEALKERWCDDLEDPEEMLPGIPEFLEYAVPRMSAAIAHLHFEAWTERNMTK